MPKAKRCRMCGRAFQARQGSEAKYCSKCRYLREGRRLNDRQREAAGMIIEPRDDETEARMNELIRARTRAIRLSWNYCSTDGPIEELRIRAMLDEVRGDYWGQDDGT